MKTLLFVVVIFVSGLVCGALICRRNLPLVEKAVVKAKKLIKKIKNKIKAGK